MSSSTGGDARVLEDNLKKPDSELWRENTSNDISVTSHHHTTQRKDTKEYPAEMYNF
jgi:hypothetical protein